MAGETGPRSRMASKISKQIFSVFGWKESTGPHDINFECLDPESHNNVKTHPTDVVFYYSDPYKAEDVYVQTDLKSYSSASVKSTNIGAAILSLGYQADCASVSEEWESRYKNTKRNFRIIGMLFVFNHDSEYKGDFKLKVDGISEGVLENLPKNSSIYIIDPERVKILTSVAMDIKTYAHDGISSYKFFYPNLVKRVSHCEGESDSATLETLNGPIIPVVQHHNDGKRSLKIYYIKEGKTEDEFHYLLDYITHFQQEIEKQKVEVCFVLSDHEAGARFQSAKEKYRLDQNIPENVTRNIELSFLSNVTTIFSEVDLGMDDRE